MWPVAHVEGRQVVPKENDWVVERVAEAARQAPVSETAASRMSELLRTLLTDRSLTSSELATVAKALIEGMAVTKPSKPSSKLS
jgi:hypothetical protein